MLARLLRKLGARDSQGEPDHALSAEERSQVPYDPPLIARVRDAHQDEFPDRANRKRDRV